MKEGIATPEKKPRTKAIYAFRAAMAEADATNALEKVRRIERKNKYTRNARERAFDSQFELFGDAPNDDILEHMSAAVEKSPDTEEESRAREEYDLEIAEMLKLNRIAEENVVKNIDGLIEEAGRMNVGIVDRVIDGLTEELSLLEETNPELKNRYKTTLTNEAGEEVDGEEASLKELFQEAREDFDEAHRYFLKAVAPLSNKKLPPEERLRRLQQAFDEYLDEYYAVRKTLNNLLYVLRSKHGNLLAEAQWIHPSRMQQDGLDGRLLRHRRGSLDLSRVDTALQTVFAPMADYISLAKDAQEAYRILGQARTNRDEALRIREQVLVHRRAAALYRANQKPDKKKKAA